MRKFALFLKRRGGDTAPYILLFATAIGVASLSYAQERALSATRKPLIVLVGDSTVTDTSGWGLGFKRYLNDKAECSNTAANGRSSKSFINEGRWKQALALKGDY